MSEITTPPLGLASGVSAEDDVFRKIAWRLVPFLFFCYLAAYLDRVNVGFAKLQMQSELSFSETVYGFGAGIFFLGYVLFEVPSNIILHKVGARLWLARVMVTWAFISAGMAFVRSPTAFYIMRFLLGAAEAGFIPGVLLYLTYWFPAARRGRIMALFLTAIPMASVFGGPLSGWILSAVSGSYGYSGWQWLFFIEAVPSLAFGIAILFYLDNRVEDAKWLEPDEKRTVARIIASEEEEKEGLSELKHAFITPRVWLLGCSLFLHRERHLYCQLLAADHHQADRRERSAYDWISYRHSLYRGGDRDGHRLQPWRPHEGAPVAYGDAGPRLRDWTGDNGGRDWQHAYRLDRSDARGRGRLHGAGLLLDASVDLPRRRGRGGGHRAGQFGRQHRRLRQHLCGRMARRPDP